MTMTQCIACGMPMNEPGDHAMDDETKEYCFHCARPDGSMVSREEALEGLTAFMVNTQGFDQAAARPAVEQMMSRLPAWKED